jgi:hypothetical protein
MKNNYLLFLSIVLLACSSANTDNISNTPSDTVTKITPKEEIVIPKVFPILINDATMKDSFPLDVSFMKKYIYPQKEFLGENWHITEFVKMDSLKTAGKYEEYLAHLDIGQTKDAKAYIYDTLSYASGKAYIWGITFNSFEACPSFAGKIIYITSVPNEGKYQYSVRLLENSSAMDAPVYGSKSGQCSINENLFIVCKDTMVNGESLEEKGKSIEETYTTTSERKIRISNSGKIELLENNRSPEKKNRTLSKY